MKSAHEYGCATQEETYIKKRKIQTTKERNKQTNKQRNKKKKKQKKASKETNK
jgi:hypothetical protein